MGRKSRPRRPRGTGEYEVGYGKPPKHTRFKPGQSGNRRGRRKHSKSGKTLLMEALNEPVLVTRGGVQRRITMREAFYKGLVARAVKGEPRSEALLIKELEQHDLVTAPNTEGKITIEFVDPPPRPKEPA